ncbi:flap endonuclease GEN-like 1 isoform X2 [Pistacia vera]|uniref:flap endonuclease GEN-like 1 isoform X2 n=1 Tax=Pistacia vera TaxID=55513 RepID=UPI0012638541|nr:flap endonuclease GEN-like 1 isoform X2 [Pistacia vera]
MGVGGKFWDLLKPYGRTEGFDFLRDKRVAVDLSYWIVQHETAIKTHARKPHLRLTFFRTINLFAKFRAYPIFVVDGTPSPLKAQARIMRFFRSCIDSSSLPVPEEGISVERNRAFQKFVKECVEPFECYCISDIEAGLGLKRKHLIAISLLVGNDHDLNGVQGIGLDTALRFVQKFSEDEILNSLHEIGNGDIPQYQSGIESADDVVPCLDESSPKKISHCSFCGHPGSKRAHFKFSCEYCCNGDSVDCIKKPEGFKCNCSNCIKNKKDKEQKKHENWWIKVCNKITMASNFPNDEIIGMYLCDNHGNSIAADGPSISWESPKTEMVVDFLVFHQLWEPSYIRQRILPMLSTIYLREMATNPVKTLLYGQYEFHSIQRVKTRYGHQSYVVKWKKAACATGNVMYAVPVEDSESHQECMEVNESVDLLDESNSPQIYVDDGCWFLLTDEDMDLVHSAFSGEVDIFLREKELKELKKKKDSRLRSEGSSKRLESPNPKGVQLSITEFYRSTKVQLQANSGEDITKNSSSQSDQTSKGKRKMSSLNLSKSARRRLLFN